MDRRVRLFIVAILLSTGTFTHVLGTGKIESVPTVSRGSSSNVTAKHSNSTVATSSGDHPRPHRGAILTELDEPNETTTESKRTTTTVGPLLPDLGDIPNWIDEWVAPAQMREWFPYYKTGYDHEGSPVYIIEFGHYNWQEVLRKKDDEDERERLKELGIKYNEQSVLHILRDGLANNSQGVGFILDFDGFNILNYAEPSVIEFSLRQFISLNRVYKVLNYVYMINVNFAAENFLRLAKPFIGHILEKCEIFGAQKSKWIPELLRMIPKSQLPSWYGGSDDWRPVIYGGAPLNVTKIL